MSLRAASMLPLIAIAMMSAPGGALAADREALAAEQAELFESRIRPLLHQHCGSCHGRTEDNEGGLDLRSQAGLLKGGQRGPAVVPGDPDASLLIGAVRRVAERGELQMPPEEKLSAKQVADLEAWVRAGAIWPATKATAGNGAAGELWSLRPVKAEVPPGVGNEGWCRTSIDRFVLSRLEQEHLTPAPAADRHTWLRRVTFDLTGLPPTPAEVAAFVADEDPQAEARVVDRLLASPAYGERWARHWLDLVRYAETNGYEYNRPKAGAFHYRDYCIDAFRQDLPFDVFVREHLAGDLMPPRVSADGARVWSAVGTAFWWFQEIQDIVTDWPKAQAEEAENQLDVFGKAFLGLTVGCARCHDHKFDPILTADYYSLAGTLFGTTNVERSIDGPQRVAELATLQAALAENERAQQALLSKARVSAAAHARRAAAAAQVGAYLLAARELLASETNADTALIQKVAAAHRLDAERLERWRQYLAGALARRDRLFRVWMRLARTSPDVFSFREQSLAQQIARGRALAARRQLRAQVLGDFESADFGSWQAQGTAFGAGPQRSRPAGAFGYEGRGFADSYRGSNAWTGRLVSPRFRITHPWQQVGVLIAGGAHPSSTYVRLGVHSQVLPQADSFSMTGDNSHEFVFKTMPAAPPLVGRDCFLEVVDEERGEWGHIRVDQAVIFEKPPADEIEADDAAYRGDNGLVAALLERASAAGPTDLAAGYEQLVVGVVEACKRAIDGAADKPELAALPLADLWDAAFTDADQRQLADWVWGGHELLLSNAEVEALLDETDRATLNELRARQTELEATITSSTLALTSAEGTAADTCIQKRGDPHSTGPLVPRGFIEVLRPAGTPPVSAGSGRLELAAWVASEHNPLTARVWVNRVWQHHFGAGLVLTPDNFGQQGARPSHPELLDYLASWFVQSGWSVKALHRELLLSGTYRQSAALSSAGRERDPDNRWLHHVPVRRLEAECVRDALLAVSGRLEPRGAGPSDPVLPAQAIPSDGAAVTDGPLSNRHRTIYLEVRRGSIPRLLTLFDFPQPDNCVGRRLTSVVPLQNLNLMNDPFVVEQARAWGQQLAADTQPPPQRIEQMFVQAFGRPALAEEREAAEAFLVRQAQARTAAGVAEAEIAVRGWTDLAHLLFSLPEFVFVR